MYRDIKESDSPDKGSHGGSCNRRSCMKPKSALYFNSSTRSYYCGTCAALINTANYVDTAPEVLCNYVPRSQVK